MKTKFILGMIASAFIALTSCTNSLDVDSYKVDNAISVNAIIDGQVPTKASETKLENLGSFKMQMTYNSVAYSSLDSYTVGTSGVISSTNTVYYWPASGDVTFRALATPSDWATIDAAAGTITKSSYTTTKAVAQDDPVVAVNTSGKVAEVPMTFYHALSRVKVHFVGTDYANDDSKGIYIVPVGQTIYTNVSGDFSYAGNVIEGKWADGRTDASKYLLVNAWSNQSCDWTAEEVFSTITGGVTGKEPEAESTFANVVPGDAATKMKLIINVCNAADGTIITKEKILDLILPAIHNHTHNAVDGSDKNDYENDGNDEGYGSQNTSGSTQTTLTGGYYQPGYGYIYDIKFYVKKTVDDGDDTTDDGTDDDYDITPIVIATIAVDTWSDKEAGEIVYGK